MSQPAPDPADASHRRVHSPPNAPPTLISAPQGQPEPVDSSTCICWTTDAGGNRNITAWARNAAGRVGYTAQVSG